MNNSKTQSGKVRVIANICRLQEKVGFPTHLSDRLNLCTLDDLRSIQDDLIYLYNARLRRYKLCKDL